MRLSEKTFELNICAQLNAIFKGKIIWFGLTQIQEARWGFDACTRLGGKLILFQFKASNKMVRGARRFYTTHQQLQGLITHTNRLQRSVFYVLPSIGTTHELQSCKGDVISNTWLLDVARLPNPFPPSHRRNGRHYIDMYTYTKPAYAEIRSDPVRIELIRLVSFFAQGAPGVDGILEDYYHFEQIRRHLNKNSLGSIILPSQ